MNPAETGIGETPASEKAPGGGEAWFRAAVEWPWPFPRAPALPPPGPGVVAGSGRLTRAQEPPAPESLRLNWKLCFKVRLAGQ